MQIHNVYACIHACTCLTTADSQHDVLVPGGVGGESFGGGERGGGANLDGGLDVPTAVGVCMGHKHTQLAIELPTHLFYKED